MLFGCLHFNLTPDWAWFNRCIHGDRAERPLRGLECKRDILQADESKCWLPMRLGRWCCYFEIAWTHYQTNSGGWLLRVGKWQDVGSLSVCSSGRQTQTYIFMHTNTDEEWLRRWYSIISLQEIEGRSRWFPDSSALHQFTNDKPKRPHALLLWHQGSKKAQYISVKIPSQ